MDADDAYGLHDSDLWLPWGVLDEMPLDLARRFAAEGKAGGHDKNRGNAEVLRRYWARGEGAVKITWGVPGDFYRCVTHVSKYMGERAKGYCALRHKEATGSWPGHAVTEQGGKAPKAEKRAAERAIGAYKGKSHAWDDLELKIADFGTLDWDEVDHLFDVDDEGRPYDDTHPEVIAQFEAEEKAYTFWAEHADPIETKGLNFRAIFDLGAWTRAMAKDAGGWLKRLYRTFGKRQQEELRQTLTELREAVGEPPKSSTASIIVGQAPNPNALDPDRIPSDFDVNAPDVASSIQNRINLLSRVDNTTFQRVQDTLAEGEAEGESIDEMADRVREVFATSKLRAATIARTEVNAAANDAQELAAKRNGAVTKTWLAVGDSRTRKQHHWVDGETTWLGSRFMVPLEVVGGVPTGYFPMRGPGDSAAPPQLTINCRCTKVYGFNLDYPGAPESPEWLARHSEHLGLSDLFESWDEGDLPEPPPRRG